MSQPILFQRLEGAALFSAATFVYFASDFSWPFYLLFLFAFDISMIGYVAGPRVGAVVYNIGHSLLAPSLLAIVYIFAENDIPLGLACLWTAHIGLDRALGYGLKFSSGFKQTHLGEIR